MRVTGTFLGVFSVIFLAAWGNVEDRRNPFGVPDVQNPDSQEVQNLLETAKLAGDANDENAEPWAKTETTGTKGSLDGEWYDRWNGNGVEWQYGTDRTRIKQVGDRVYMLVNASNGKYLLDLKRTKNRLAGKYLGVENASDSGPCVFIIVDDERIDGNWNGSGRWDFRRKLKPQ